MQPALLLSMYTGPAVPVLKIRFWKHTLPQLQLFPLKTVYSNSSVHFFKTSSPMIAPFIVSRLRVHLNRWGRQFSRLLVVEECGSAGSDCIICTTSVDHSLKMSLQGGKKWVKRSGGREIVYNVYKFTKTESEVGITIPLSKVQKRVAEAGEFV